MRKALGAGCLLLISLSAAGQGTPATPPRPGYVLIHEEIAKPSMLVQYEATTRDINKALTDTHADPKNFAMNLYVTSDMHYLYVWPIANWAAIDAMQQNFVSLGQTIGQDRWRDLMNRGNSAMYSYNEFVAQLRPDLSYVPATPRLKPEERRFVHWIFYYVDAAHMQEAEQVAKDYAALFRAKNIADPFTTYQVVSGNDLPILVAAVPAKSAADYYANDEKVNAALGADVQPLAARALAITRKYEVRDGIYRPDLSYPVVATEKK
ncbi:MAG TPA: hypothetical protein VF980_17155 [Thermoanaerobaculia bacterium]